MMHHHRIVVLYDSITNSVFISQVLYPLQDWLAGNKQRTATLISFESQKITNHPHGASLIKEKRITLVIRRRLPFFGILSLWYATRCIQKIMQKHPQATIIARGPFASYACLHAQTNKDRSPLIMQARGLVVDEYVYAQQHTTKDWCYRLKLFLYTKLESAVYRQGHPNNIIIEVISPAMREHFIKKYGLQENTITIACNDIPQSIHHKKLRKWRVAQRKLLEIPLDAHVYCYNGSSKPWQCPPLFFTFCKTTIAPDSKAHLLILSQDLESFKKLMIKTMIPKVRYHLITVEHHEIYQYLAAADTGLIFRDATLLNWVSRPTKLLEYQAVGLKIVHNNSIAWLIESAKNQQPYVVAPLAQQESRMIETLSAHSTP